MSRVFTRQTRPSIARGDNPIVFATRLYVQFLQGLFNFNPMGSYHWEPDRELSEILITAEAPINMDVAGKRPALTVVMGPYNYQGLGIDNMLSFNMNTDRRVRSDLISGHIVVYCLAETDIVTQHLAHLVIQGTRVNQRLLEGRGGFHQISRPAPSANSPSPPGALVAGDPKGLVMIQVNIPFTLQWTWATTPTAPSRDRDLSMITQERRASDFPYTSPSTLEKVELAMSDTPVLIRRLGAGGVVTTLSVTDGEVIQQDVVAADSTE
jgi:hypothetical protein